MNISKNLVLILFILFFSSANAQSTEAPEALQVNINHIALHVSDLEKSTEFYEEILGLKQIPEPFKDGRHAWFKIGPYSQLHLISGAHHIGKQDKNSHLCFSVKSVDDFIPTLDKHEIKRVNWLGTSRGPTIRIDGIKQIYFQDPDGYWIEVNDDYVGR